jgi:hypothetical protein
MQKTSEVVQKRFWDTPNVVWTRKKTFLKTENIFSRTAKTFSAFEKMFLSLEKIFSIAEKIFSITQKMVGNDRRCKLHHSNNLIIDQEDGRKDEEDLLAAFDHNLCKKGLGSGDAEDIASLQIIF